MVLLPSGLLAIGLGLFNLFHEFRAAEVDTVYAVVALIGAVVWLAAIIAAFAGWRVGAFLAALFAFVEFGLIASTHFVSGPAALETYVTQQGLPVATVDMALIPACLLVVMSAAVCWTNPRGRKRRLDMLPVLVVSLIGSVLVILQATDAMHRSNFGAANPQDGTFAAAVFASLWLAGGLWIASLRRTGALMIALATFGVSFSFVTLHLVGGSTTVSQIATRSGIGWAVISAATAVLALACLLLALGLLVVSIVPRKPGTPDEVRAARRRA